MQQKIRCSWYGKQSARTLSTQKSWFIAKRQTSRIVNNSPIVKGSLGSNSGWWQITSFSLFCHNKINAIVKEEFTCLKFEVNWLAILFCKDVSMGKKETTKKFQLEILATNSANSSPTKITDAHRKWCERQCHILRKSCGFFFPLYWN